MTANRFFRFKMSLWAALAALFLVLVSTTASEARNRHYSGGGFFIGPGFGFAIGTGGAYGGVYSSRRYYGYRNPGRYYGYRPYAPRHYPRRAYRPYLYAPPLALYPPQSRVYVGPPGRVPPTKTGLQPFTPGWYAYCSRKFKSFDPRSGTYLAYSGRVRFCR